MPSCAGDHVNIVAPICPYCLKSSKLVKGNVIYPLRKHLYAKSYYHCSRCKAWVGCHPNSIEPMGRLANASLRTARMEAHAAFDPIWETASGSNGRTKRTERLKAYIWLARELGMPVRDCHIGMFDIKTCRKVVMLCQALTTPRNTEHFTGSATASSVGDQSSRT